MSNVRGVLGVLLFFTVLLVVGQAAAQDCGSDQVFQSVGVELPNGDFCCGMRNAPCTARPDHHEQRCRCGRHRTKLFECDPNLCADFFAGVLDQCLPVNEGGTDQELPDGLDQNCDGLGIGDEFCDGIDNDNDGRVDEDQGACLLRFLAVPLCWNGSDQTFQDVVDQQASTFMIGTGL